MSADFYSWSKESLVMFAEDGEEGRLCATIDGLIAAGELASTKKYELFKKTVADDAAKGKKKKAVCK